MSQGGFCRDRGCSSETIASCLGCPDLRDWAEKQAVMPAVPLQKKWDENKQKRTHELVDILKKYTDSEIKVASQAVLEERRKKKEEKEKLLCMLQGMDLEDLRELVQQVTSALEKKDD